MFDFTDILAKQTFFYRYRHYWRMPSHIHNLFCMFVENHWASGFWKRNAKRVLFVIFGCLWDLLVNNVSMYTHENNCLPVPDRPEIWKGYVMTHEFVNRTRPTARYLKEMKSKTSLIARTTDSTFFKEKEISCVILIPKGASNEFWECLAILSLIFILFFFFQNK